MFKIRLFKESLKNSLDSFESKFLIRTFLYSSFTFLVFGFLLIILALINQPSNFIGNSVFKFFSACLAIGSFGWFIFLFNKYRESPLNVDKRFINKIFLLLIFTYLFSFLFLFSVFGPFFNLKDIKNQISFICYVFGQCFFLYLIPACIAAYIKKHKKHLTLMQFIKYSYAFYLPIFLGFFIALCCFKIIETPLSGFCYILVSLILLTAPIFSLYRLKLTSSYIDYVDRLSIYKWELFFALEILIQLIHLPILVLHVMIMYLSNKPKR